MAKKQNPQILSPENYIRQRARNLPFHECLINDDWQNSGLAYVTIARRHINGNITSCFYLVDKDCLGIKDSFYKFNISEDEYEEMKEQISSGMDLMKIEYTLAHNIIFAAIEFAEEIGFKPHKDFLSVTQYMLEEDSDDIPVIAIECGDEDGRPVYVRGPLDSDARATQIVRHLEQTLGEGNYTTILSDDEDEDDFWDDDDSYYEQFADKSFEENASLFLELSETFNNTRDRDFEEASDMLNEIIALSKILYEELVDEDELNAWLYKWDDEERHLRIAEKIYFPEMLGLANDQTFTNADEQQLDELEAQEETYNFVVERWGDIPYALYLALDNNTTSEKKINKLIKQFPDYALFSIAKINLNIEKGKAGEESIDYKTIFKNRNEISLIEYGKFLTMKLNYFMSTNDLSGVESVYTQISNLENWDQEDLNIVETMALVAKLTALERYLSNNQ